MDMRYLRTEKHLRKACLHLREKAGIPSLTVTQLTREAEVNRITFYAHYDNVDQLVDRLEAESIQAFLQQAAPFEDFLRRPEALIRRMPEVPGAGNLRKRGSPPLSEKSAGCSPMNGNPSISGSFSPSTGYRASFFIAA